MPQPIVLPIAEYAPDRPALLGGSSGSIRNVYPRTANSYGPIASPRAQYNALGSRCQGACAYRDSSGNVFLFAGDANDLWNLKSGLTAWDEVSKAHNAYTTPSDMQWQFIYFNGRVIATNFFDPLQSFVLASSADFANLAGSPPKARYIATVKNAFVVLANTFDGVNGNMPQRVWWSAAGDPTNWPAVGTTAAAQVQSGAADLLGDGGWIQGIAADLANADAAIFMQYSVKRMIYAGPPTVWEFLPVQAAHGLLAPYSLVVHGGIAYGLAQGGFFAFDGAMSKPIGFDRVDKTVLADLDMGNVHRFVGTDDPINKLIWWAYPGTGNNLGNPNRLLCYSIPLDRFTIADVTCETLMRMLGIGYTLDELYTILGYTFQTLPAPLDSSLWTGGTLQMGLFDETHTLNFLSGLPLAATVETEERQPVAGRRVLIRGSTPYVDGVDTAVSVAIGRRERMQADPTYTDAVAINRLGNCNVRTSGKYVRARITVPAGATGWQNISGISLDAVAQGSR